LTPVHDIAKFASHFKLNQNQRTDGPTGVFLKDTAVQTDYFMASYLEVNAPNYPSLATSNTLNGAIFATKLIVHIFVPTCHKGHSTSDMWRPGCTQVCMFN